MIDWLLDASQFTPRAHCGTGWSDSLVFAYQLSSTIIFICYVLIPFGCVALYRKIVAGETIPMFRLGTLLFGGFITTCGVTHLMDRIVFRWPAYRLSTLLLLICASFSMATVAWLFLALGGTRGRK